MLFSPLRHLALFLSVISICSSATSNLMGNGDPSSCVVSPIQFGGDFKASMSEAHPHVCISVPPKPSGSLRALRLDGISGTCSFVGRKDPAHSFYPPFYFHTNFSFSKGEQAILPIDEFDDIPGWNATMLVNFTYYEGDGCVLSMKAVLIPIQRISLEEAKTYSDSSPSERAITTTVTYEEMESPVAVEMSNLKGVCNASITFIAQWNAGSNVHQNIMNFSPGQKAILPIDITSDDTHTTNFSSIIAIHQGTCTYDVKFHLLKTKWVQYHEPPVHTQISGVGAFSYFLGEAPEGSISTLRLIASSGTCSLRGTNSVESIVPREVVIPQQTLRPTSPIFLGDVSIHIPSNQMLLLIVNGTCNLTVESFYVYPKLLRLGEKYLTKNVDGGNETAIVSRLSLDGLSMVKTMLRGGETEPMVASSSTPPPCAVDVVQTDMPGNVWRHGPYTLAPNALHSFEVGPIASPGNLTTVVRVLHGSRCAYSILQKATKSL